jgi:hypothetical protein
VKSKRMEILAAAVVLFIIVSPVMAAIHFRDGGVHDIDYTIRDDVWVDFETPGIGTTVNFLEGGSITRYKDLQCFEDSIINVLGGSISWSFIAYDSSQVTVSGGLIRYPFNAYDSSQVTVSGGQMGHLCASDSSQVTISGGQMGDLCASDSSQVTISGGVLEEALIVDSHGTMAIYGSDFAVDGTPVGYIELSSILGGPLRNEPHRRLTGTLASGEPINNDFQIGHSAKIVLVPEPATLLLLGLGGMALLRRRRHG